MPEASALTIILPVHNRKSITVRFTRCLERQTFQDFRLLLIDDGSTDGTAEAVRSVLPAVEVIRGDGYLWWAGSLQRGVDWLRTRGTAPDHRILIINDDTDIAENFLELGLRLLQEFPGEIFCARAYSTDGTQLLDAGVRVDWRRYRFLPAATEEEINCLSTRGLFLRWSDILGIGEFRPKWLPHYLSDYEFTVRAHRRGFRLRSPDTLRLRMNEQTTGVHQLDGLGLREYLRRAFQTRSAINPWTAAKFIALAAPRRHLLPAYFQLSVFFGKSVLKALLHGI